MQRTGEPGRDLIKEKEKLGPKYNWVKKTGRIVAYLCPARVPTIGYGHTKGVLRSDVGVREISLEQAEGLLSADLAPREAYLNGLGLKLNSNQFDALISLIYNCGSLGTTLVAQLRKGDFKNATVTMKKYIHSTGPDSEPCAGRCGNKACKLRTFPGLIIRRDEEIKLFKKAVD